MSYWQEIFWGYFFSGAPSIDQPVLNPSLCCSSRAVRRDVNVFTDPLPVSADCDEDERDDDDHEQYGTDDSGDQQQKPKRVYRHGKAKQSKDV